MNYYAGIEVCFEASSVCLVAAGRPSPKTEVASDPDALIEHFLLELP